MREGMGVGRESRLILLTDVAGLDKKSALNAVPVLPPTLFLALLRRKEKEVEGGGVKVPWAKKLRMLPVPGW